MKILTLKSKLKNYYKRRGNSFLKQLPTFLLVLLILFQPISSVYAQRIASSCTSNNSLDIKSYGIHNKTGSINIPMGSKVNKVVVECTCRGFDGSTCPTTIKFTVNGSNVFADRTKVDVYSTFDGDRGVFYVYRLVQNAPITSLIYNAPASFPERLGMRGMTAWIVNNDAANANQPQSIFIDEFHYQHPARSFEIPIKPTNAARNIVIHIPVSEIQNSSSKRVRYNAVALNASGTEVSAKISDEFTDNNDESEIRLDKLSLNGVPGNATKIKVWIESPEDSNGTSFMIGSIALTSDQNEPTLTCPAGGTVACSSDIETGTPTYEPACPDDNRTPTVNRPVINSEADCPGTTYTYTHSAGGASCKQVFTIQNDAPVIFCPENVQVVCEADITPAFPEYFVSCGLEATQNISEPIISGEPGCPGTTYTYTYTLTDACGRIASCEQVFEIGNNPGPTIINHGDVQVVCEADIIPVFPEYITGCDLGATEIIKGPVIEGTEGCDGTTYTYTYTLTDACGRSTSCLQVFAIVDYADPTIICNADIEVVCESEIEMKFPEYVIHCGGNAIESVCGPIIEGIEGEVGAIYRYMYTVTDNCGRSASCEQVFEIEDGCDYCNIDDWRALKEIYETTNGPNWHFQIGWEQVMGDVPPPNCNLGNMQGVALDRKTKRVIDLILFGVKGEFPDAIGELSELEYLTIVGADFMSNSIPPKIGNLKKLKELVLANNNIGGQLPAELAMLSNLTLLTLNDNELSGSYPPGYEIFCTQLTHHRFHCNASISDGNHFDETWEEFCTTGVCKNYKRARFDDYTIHPNPCTGKVFIQFEKESKNDRIIRVFDNLGKAYESVSYRGIDDSIELDLSELPKGIYLVELKEGDYLRTEKLVLK